MIDVKTADQALQTYIRPQTFPVGVRMLRPGEPIPERARRPARDFGKLSMNCQVIDMSPGNVALRADRPGAPGEKVIAYIDHIGRVEGVVTRTMSDGFAMTVIASDRKKNKLAAQLTWLANKHELDLPEDRRHDRIAPRNPASLLQLMDGRQFPCRIIDLSL